MVRYTLISIILCVWSITVIGQTNDSVEYTQLTQEQFDEIFERSQSYNPKTAIESNELLYDIAKNSNNSNLAFYSSLNLARKYYFLMNQNKRKFWDEKALDALSQMHENDSIWKELYRLNTEIWKGDSTYGERITTKDVLELCQTDQNAICVLFNSMPKRGLKMCDDILEQCTEHHEECSIAAFNAYLSKGKLTNKQGYPRLANSYFYKAFSIQQDFVKHYLPYLTEDDRFFVWKSGFENAFNFVEQAAHAEMLGDSEIMFKAYDQLLLTKGILLSTSNAIRSAINKDSELLGKWKELCDQKRKLSENPLNTDKRAEAEFEVSTLEREISDSLDLRKLTDELSINSKDIYKSLKDDELAIEFFRFSDGGYYGLLMSNTHSTPVAFPCGDIEKQRNIPDNEYKTTNDLYKYIWDMVIKFRPKTKTIYFSPIGIFNTLPIEHCMTDNGEIMSERFNMYRLSSTREIVVKCRDGVAKDAGVFGGIQFDTSITKLQNDAKHYVAAVNSDNVKRGDDAIRSWKDYIEPLNNTGIEAETICKIMKKSKYKPHIYKGEKATETSFKSLSGNSPSILHFATHGFFWNKEESKEYQDLDFLKNSDDQLSQYEDNALNRSGLLFAGAYNVMKNEKIPVGIDNGVCTAAEISLLDLSNTDLVVLSACNTGLGDIEGDGVFGLQRGFKKAGVNSILMSLWPVNDKATMLFMTEFYNNLTSGKSKIESLRNAQSFVRNYNNGYYNSKENWAGFVLIDGVK